MRKADEDEKGDKDEKDKGGAGGEIDKIEPRRLRE
jgi:hypothetical protein